MPYESWMNRTWYRRGVAAGMRGRYSDMTEAWQKQTGRPKTPGKRVDAQETFYQGYSDGQDKRKNPSFRRTKKAAAKIGARLTSSRRIKAAVRRPRQTKVSRALDQLLRSALRKRKSARARVVRNKRGLTQLLIG